MFPVKLGFNHNWLPSYCFAGFMLSKFCQVLSASAEGSTFNNQSLLVPESCVPFAFADFNADRMSDVYCVSDEGTEIQVFSYMTGLTPGKRLASTQLSSSYTITSLIATDLDGDTMVDTVVIYDNSQRLKGSQGNLAVIWGNNKNLSEWSQLPEYRFKSWPLVTSIFNNSVELFGEINDKIGFLRFMPDRKYALVPFEERSGEVKISFEVPDFKLNSQLTQAYVDLTGDGVADLFLTTGKSKEEFQIWSNQGNHTLQKAKSYGLPTENIVPYPSIFADVGANGTMIHLLPACLNKDCSRVDIFGRVNNEWISMLKNQSLDGYRLLDPKRISGFWGSETAMVVKIQDVNLDTFPDLLVILQRPENSTEYVVAVLQNMDNGNAGRMFVLNDLMKFDKPVVSATFQDVDGNGYPDIMACVYDSQKKSYDLIAFENKAAEDALFFKVVAVGGHCRTAGCTDDSAGNNFPGVTMVLQITNKAGRLVSMSAAHSTHSAHFALQPSFITFGLGSLPNFVEHLIVSTGQPISLPTTDEHQHLYTRTWSQLIPNSHVMINIYPRHGMHSWQMRLFLNPSKLVLHTGVALAVLCFVLLCVIIGLHIKEKQEDDIRKKYDSQRFRYDTL